jgi:hypothetical protein
MFRLHLAPRIIAVLATHLTAALILVLAIGGPAQPAWGLVCHDGNWGYGEFCGRDAYLVTGSGEMNHDCFVDYLDVRLFAEEWQMTGPNLSADLNGDGTVEVFDYLLLWASGCSAVSPCTRSGMLRDGCKGTLALSFSDNPATIVSTKTQSPGPGTVYFVVDGWTDAEVIEYAVETSSNVEIVGHGYPSHDYWAVGSTVTWDEHHSFGGFVSVSGSWPSGPIIWSELDYDLLDSNPAWIKLMSWPAACGTRVRWATGAANGSIDFRTLLNVGINGPAPAGESTCTAQLPALSPPMTSVLAGILLAVGLAVLGRRWGARS